MFVEQNTVLLDVVVANKYSLKVIHILNLRRIYAAKYMWGIFFSKTHFWGFFFFLPIKQNNAGIYQCFALVRKLGRHSALKANTSCRPYKNLASPARRKQLTFRLSCCCFFFICMWNTQELFVLVKHSKILFSFCHKHSICVFL